MKMKDQLERRLRDLRNAAFNEDAPADITDQIKAVKAQLQPYWEERAAKVAQARSEALLRLWA